jgi:beta-lactamase superfamily II metal-dependent hydrolase
MPTVHFLNVGNGDCIIIEHGSGHVTMIDICSGNLVQKRAESIANIIEEAIKGNFQMADKPTNPISYLKKIGHTSLFRFILSHPDMDHLNGFKALREQIGFANFWDSGVRREKPDFGEGCPYSEEDWDEYVAVRDGNRQGIKVVTPKAGGQFQFANKKEDGSAGGDGLNIASPDQAWVDEVNKNNDLNAGSYIITYHTAGGIFIFPGDAHDHGWNFATTKYPGYVNNCSILIAPHHGRKSERSFDFLDKIKPKLALFGCAPSEHLAYDAFSRREIHVITNNQAGNVIMDSGDNGIDVYVENRIFAQKHEGFDENKQKHGCYFIGYVPKPESK